MSNMVIQTNMLSLNAHRNMGITGTAQARASARLSSGFRINSAADDAAGLGISEKMRGQIRGLDQASRNAQDGISLIQTAEGAMQTVNDIVIRIRELTVQAANDTNVHDDANVAQSDRARIQDEINQLLDEIDQIAYRTEFNTRTLLNGDWAAEQTVTVLPPGGEGGAVTPPPATDWQTVFQNYGILDTRNTAANRLAMAALFAHTTGGNLFAADIDGEIDAQIGAQRSGTNPPSVVLRAGLNGVMAERAINNAINAAIDALIGYDPNSHADRQAAASAWLSSVGAQVEPGIHPGTGEDAGAGIQDIAQLLGADEQAIARMFAATDDMDLMDNIAAAQAAVMEALSVDAIEGWIIQNDALDPANNVRHAWSFDNNVVRFNTAADGGALISDHAAARAAVNAALAAEITLLLNGTGDATNANLHSRIGDLIAALTGDIFTANGTDRRVLNLEELLGGGRETEVTYTDATINAAGLLTFGQDGGDVYTAAGTETGGARLTIASATMNVVGGTASTAVNLVVNNANSAAPTVQLGAVAGNANDTTLVPDGERTVTVTWSDGTTQTFDVRARNTAATTSAMEWQFSAGNPAAGVAGTSPAARANVAPVDGINDFSTLLNGRNVIASLSSAIDAALEEFWIDPNNRPEAPAPDPEVIVSGGNSLWFHIGANESQGVRLHIENVSVDALGLSHMRTVTAGNVLLGGSVAQGDTGFSGVMLESGEDLGSTETGFLRSLDDALAVVTSQRSILGAMQNRLEFSIQNLDIASENLQAANSRIRDADMAREMMRFTQTNVLQQAAISMLAQANQAPQNILQLLR